MIEWVAAGLTSSPGPRSSELRTIHHIVLLYILSSIIVRTPRCMGLWPVTQYLQLYYNPETAPFSSHRYGLTISQHGTWVLSLTVRILVLFITLPISMISLWTPTLWNPGLTHRGAQHTYAEAKSQPPSLRVTWHYTLVRLVTPCYTVLHLVTPCYALVH